MSKNENTLPISKIRPNTTLSLVATKGGKKLELPVRYANLTPDEADELAEKYNGRILPIEKMVFRIDDQNVSINFKGNDSVFELLAVTEQGVFHWDNVKIYKATLASGRSVQVIFTSRIDGDKFNRRRGVRVNFDKLMQIEQNGQKYNVVVREISYCGMSFVQPKDVDIQKGEEFKLYLSEMDENGEDKLVGTFNGQILNKRTLDSGHVVCGCVISAEHATVLQRYIARKQMEQVSGRKAEKTITKVKTGDYWQNDLAEVLNESIT